MSAVTQEGGPLAVVPGWVKRAQSGIVGEAVPQLVLDSLEGNVLFRARWPRDKPS